MASKNDIWLSKTDVRILKIVHKILHQISQHSLLCSKKLQEKQQYDMKNIRRRVYDALNVLMAMNIIEKEKKEIRWVGLPTSSLQECRKLEEEKAKRQERIQRKTEQLQDLIIQVKWTFSLHENHSKCVAFLWLIAGKVVIGILYKGGY